MMECIRLAMTTEEWCRAFPLLLVPDERVDTVMILTRLPAEGAGVVAAARKAMMVAGSAVINGRPAQPESSPSLVVGSKYVALIIAITFRGLWVSVVPGSRIRKKSRGIEREPVDAYLSRLGMYVLEDISR